MKKSKKKLINHFGKYSENIIFTPCKSCFHNLVCKLIKEKNRSGRECLKYFDEKKINLLKIDFRNVVETKNIKIEE